MKYLLILMISLSIYADFTTLSTQEVESLKQNNIPIIDIRTKVEYQKSGIIEGSFKIPFFDRYGKYDLQQWLHEFKKIVQSKDNKFILVCAHANRSKVVGKMLSEKLGYKNVYELDGGIKYGWIDKNLPVGH